MSVLHSENVDLFLLEETLWILSKSIQPSYDFDFRQHFHCQHPPELPHTCLAVSRAGPRVYYNLFYKDLLGDGVQLIHDPETHLLCSELPRWYPYIAELTPRSMWFDEVPDIETIMAHFEFPIFVRGSE